MAEPKNEKLTLKVIAHYYCDLEEKFGTPRQSGRIEGLCGEIVFEKEYAVSDALRGIEGFSHLWLIWGFSLFEHDRWSPTVRPPRLGGNKRVGVFASRSPNRPNPLGLTVVRLLGVRKENDRLVLPVCGADLVSGTPIYDIKPYLAPYDSLPNAVSGYAQDYTDYRLKVKIPDELLSLMPEEKRETLSALLSEDPRPGYKKGEERYGLSYAGYEIAFFVDDHNTVIVTEIKKKTER